MSEWKEYKLEELCTKITDGSHSSPKEETNGNRIIATVKDMLEFDFDYSNCKRITEQEYIKLLQNDCKPLKNDILFSKDGTIGKIILFNGKVDLVILSSIAILRPDLELVDPRYLAYFLKSDSSQKDINDNYRSGSVIPRVILKDFKRLPVSIPSLPTQTAIAEILSSLDDKIELNNKINQELENLAQTLFKQWFIDFEFPNENGEPYRSSGGEMVDSELGEIPKSWIATNYGAITKKENLKVKKSKKSITKVYSAIKTSELVLSEDYFTKQVFSKSLENYYVVENFWFAYNPSRINIGSIGLNKNEAGAVSPVYVVFSTVDNMHFYIENHLKLENIKNEIIQKCSGTVRQALNYDSLSTFPVVKPPKSLIDKFNLFWAENSNLISQIKSETEYLIGLRDELLPKLIAGELEVSDIQTKTL